MLLRSLALKCNVPYTTTLSNLLYIWWKARMLLLPWLLIWEKTAAAVLFLSLAPFPQNNILAYCAP